jgi:hypothetical protein
LTSKTEANLSPYFVETSENFTSLTKRYSQNLALLVVLDRISIETEFNASSS